VFTNLFSLLYVEIRKISQLVSSVVSKLKSFLHKNNPELRLLQTDVRYYYKQPCFRSYRYLNNVVIVIEAPLTIAPLNKLMNVFHVYKVPILTPNSVEYYTTINEQ